MCQVDLVGVNLVGVDLEGRYRIMDCIQKIKLLLYTLPKQQLTIIYSEKFLMGANVCGLIYFRKNINHENEPSCEV